MISRFKKSIAKVLLGVVLITSLDLSGITESSLVVHAEEPRHENFTIKWDGNVRGGIASQVTDLFNTADSNGYIDPLGIGEVVGKNSGHWWDNSDVILSQYARNYFDGDTGTDPTYVGYVAASCITIYYNTASREVQKIQQSVVIRESTQIGNVDGNVDFDEVRSTVSKEDYNFSMIQHNDCKIEYTTIAPYIKINTTNRSKGAELDKTVGYKPSEEEIYQKVYVSNVDNDIIASDADKFFKDYFRVQVTSGGDYYTVSSNLPSGNGTIVPGGASNDVVDGPNASTAFLEIIKNYDSSYGIPVGDNAVEGASGLAETVLLAAHSETVNGQEDILSDQSGNYFYNIGVADQFHLVQAILQNSLTYSKTKYSNLSSSHTLDESKPIYGYVGSKGSVETPVQINVKHDKTNHGFTFEGLSLTDYQYDSLMDVYTTLYVARDCARSKDEYDFRFFDFLNKDNESLSKSEIADCITGEFKNKDGSLSSMPVNKEDVLDLIEEYENLQFVPAASEIMNIARLSNTLSKYVLYQAIAENQADTAISESSITYNADLQTRAASWAAFAEMDTANSTVNGITGAYAGLPEKVPLLDSGYGMLVDDSINGSLGFNAINMIFSAISYTFYCLENDPNDEYRGWTAENLKLVLTPGEDLDTANQEKLADLLSVTDWLTSCRGTSQYDTEKLKSVYIENPTSVWIFRALIELYDTVNFFEIDPALWTPEVYAYYSLVRDNPDIFNALRENTSIYGAGYSGDVNIRNPLGKFYSVQSKEMSENWNIGYALSSLYVPMQTNLYDIGTYNFVATQNAEWLTEFMYKYGFYRKALYISTDPNIVVNTKLNRSSENGKKVATLADLLNYNRDLQLYVDTGFYNADQIADAIGKVDYATLYQYTHQQEQTTNVKDSAAISNLEGNNGTTIKNNKSKNFIDETLNLDSDTLLKDNNVESYSIDIAKDVTKLGDTQTETKSLYDGYVLSADAITSKDGIFGLYDYSPMISYGIVSAIYRDIDTYNAVAMIPAESQIVFKSSKNILYVNNTSKSDWLAYMNYIQLSRLEYLMNQNVETQLDLNNPIFIDVFGNIVTESGYVIIPAASNATLVTTSASSVWNPYTIAFGLACKNDGLELDMDNLPADVVAWLCSNVEEVETTDVDNSSAFSSGGWFVKTRDNKIQLKNTRLVSHGLIATINWASLNSHSDVIQEVFWNNTLYTKAIYAYNTRVLNMVTEVMRGAPVEYIDYEKEGLEYSDGSSAGVVIAYALDKMMESVISKSKDYVNSLVTMPNLAIMPYLKYFVYFGIKITLALFVVIFLIRLFMNGVQNKFGFKAVMSYTFTVIIVASAIWVLPSSINWSYDQANSTLLSTEAADILLYATLRENEGQEIGITNVQEIDEDTELLMHVDTIPLNWMYILSKGILTNEYGSFTDLFDDMASETPYVGMPNVQIKGTKVYISASDILDSTRVSYNRSSNYITNKMLIKQSEAGTGNNLYAVYSFNSPYYVILDQLIANINEYNDTHDVQTFQASVNSKGTVITYDVSAPYFMSDEFLVDGYDILGLTDALQLNYTLPKYTYIFDQSNKAAMRQSAWFPDENLSEETKQERVSEVYSYIRAFVTEHADVIRHMPDQEFIKIVAFAAAVKYNQVFHVPYANSIKLINVDNRDLIRFMTANFSKIYKNYSYTFGRSVYNTSGTVGVILAAVLCVIIMLTSVLKPILIAILFIIIIINIMFRQILLNKPNQGVEGYFIGCALFMIINFIYAGLLKFCFYISNTDATPIAAMLICIVVQILYLLGLIALIYTQVSDWKNSGFLKYATAFGGVVAAFGASKFRYDPVRDNPYYYDRRRYNYNDYDEYDDLGTVSIRNRNSEPQAVYVEDKPVKRGNRTTWDGRRSLNDMRERDEEREDSPHRRTY